DPRSARPGARPFARPLARLRNRELRADAPRLHRGRGEGAGLARHGRQPAAGRLMTRAPILRLAFIAVAAFTIAVGVVALWPKPQGVDRGSGESLIGGPFALTDADGKRRTDAEFRGRHMLVFYGFTNCPDFCPTALVTISQALEKLGPKAEKLAPLFVT